MGKLRGVVILLEDLVKKIKDGDGSRVTKKVFLFESSAMKLCPLMT